MDQMKTAFSNSGIEHPSKRIDRIYGSLKYKFNLTLKEINKDQSLFRYYLLREELEPILTEEEKEFIGFWKGNWSKKPEHIKLDCLEKRMMRATYKLFPNLKKELRDAGNGK